MFQTLEKYFRCLLYFNKDELHAYRHFILDENTKEEALQLPSYFLKVAERKLYAKEKEASTLPPSVSFFTDNSSVNTQAFPYTLSNYQKKSWTGA